MAHSESRRTHPAQNLILPLRLAGKIKPIFDAVAVGEWIVGYAFPEDEEHWVPDQSYEYEFGGSPPEDWLSMMINSTRSDLPSPEKVRRFLVRNGAFRERDWVTVEDALKSGLPDEVKKEIHRSKLPGKALTHVLRVEDFYREWRLLESLVLIAGRLAERSSVLMLPDAERAKSLLEQIRKGDSLPRVGKFHARSPATTELFDFFDAHGVSQSANTAVTSPRNSLPLAQRVRQMVTGVFNSAIFRAIRQRPYTIWWPSFESGPRIRVEVFSILAAAYLALLANLSHGWKRCARQDCGNIFRVTDDKRKIFCSQYCGHLVSLRKKRKAAGKRKSRK